MFLKLREAVLVTVACALVFAGAIPGCTYSKDYFRIGPDGKKIKADGPLLPGEDTGGFGTGGASGSTTGDGTITPTGGSGTGATTGGGVVGTPVYPFVINGEDSSNVHNLYLARFSEGVLLEAPKKITAFTDSNVAILFPSLSPDAAKALYVATTATGSIFDGTLSTDIGLHLVTDALGTPHDAVWPVGEPGLSASWSADGTEAVFVGGAGCGLIKKAKSDGSGVTTEANQPAGTHTAGNFEKWIHFQTSMSPVKEAANPANGLVLFSMASFDETAPEQGFDLFAKKEGDPDQDHYMRITNTPTTIEIYPTISPDGKYVLFSLIDSSSGGTTTGGGSSGDAPQKLAVCDLVFTSGVGACQNTRTLDGMPAGTSNTSPCWAWDSSKIFFASKDATSKKYDVYEVDFTGGSFGSPTNVTNSDGLDEMELSCASGPMTK